MEAATSPRDPAIRVPPGAVLREPLFWANAAAFAGAAFGLLGNFLQVHVQSSPGYEWVFVVFLSKLLRPLGEALALFSLLGIPPLLAAGEALRKPARHAVRVGAALVTLSAAVCLASDLFIIYMNTAWLNGYNGVHPPPVFRVGIGSFWAALLLPPVAVAPFLAAALFCGAERLKRLLAGLFLASVPFALIHLLLFPSDLHSYQGPSTEATVLGLYGGVGLPSALLWVLLGRMLLEGARGRALGKAARAEAAANLVRARRLYEKGLGKGDLSVVDELVSESFRDLRHGGRGKRGMRRVITDLRRSFPDLAVHIQEQEAEGDRVRTYLLLSGTDRGGVLWYPPTNRHATFPAEFVNRFAGGELVEHRGWTDTEGLLVQLGLRSPVNSS